VLTTSRGSCFLVILSVLVIRLATVAHAQGYADAIVDLPPVLGTLTMGMARADVEKRIPDAKPFGTATAAKSALFLYFAKPDPWDGAMLEFLDGRLEGINLLVGVTKGSDLLARSQKAITALIGRHGAKYERLISINSALQPVPLYWWSKNDFSLFAVGPSAGVARSGVELVPSDPSLRVGIVRKERAVRDVVRVASSEELQEAIFRAVSTVSK
jgi:hypothetical protein